MQCSWKIVLMVVGAAWIMPGPIQADQPKSQKKSAAPQQNAEQQSSVTVSDEDKQRAAALAQNASAVEQKMAQRVRWVELQLKKEEKLLEQRLTYAAQLRASALQKNDEKLLQQAEQYERRSLLAFEQRIKQYERMLQAPASTSTPTSNSKNTSTTPSRSRKTTRPTSRSTHKPHPQSRLIRRR